MPAEKKQVWGAKPVWTKISLVKELTGWDSNFIRKARRQGLVKYRHQNGEVNYLLNSIDPIFLKKTA